MSGEAIQQGPYTTPPLRSSLSGEVCGLEAVIEKWLVLTNTSNRVGLVTEAVEGHELAVGAVKPVNARSIVHAVKCGRVCGKDGQRHARFADLVDNRVHAVLGHGRVLVVVRVREGFGVVVDRHVGVGVMNGTGAFVVRIVATFVHAVEGEVSDPAQADGVRGVMES